jgi:hypothetical protein
MEWLDEQSWTLIGVVLGIGVIEVCVIQSNSWQQLLSKATI